MLLDRYIIRQFLINYVILLAVLLLLFVLVDFMIDMDEFTQAGERRAVAEAVQRESAALGVPPEDIAVLERAPVEAVMNRLNVPYEQAERIADALDPGGWRVWRWTLFYIGDYYLPLVLMLYVFFSGLVVVGAMGFTFSSLARSRELTALLSSGISLYRVATPVLITGAILSMVSLPMQELVIPQFASKLIRSKADLKSLDHGEVPVEFAADGEGNLLRAQHFNEQLDRPMMRNVTIIERNDQRVITRMIRAQQAVWSPEMGGWELINGFVHDPPLPEFATGGATRQVAPQEQNFFATSLSPAVLLARQATLYQQLLPITRLQPMQANPAIPTSQQNRITQIIWSRFSLQVLNVLVLVMGLPFFLVRRPMNPLVQGVKCAGVCMGVWCTGVVLLQGSTHLLPPVATAWLPVVVALPLSAWLLMSIET